MGVTTLDLALEGQAKESGLGEFLRTTGLPRLVYFVNF